MPGSIGAALRRPLRYYGSLWPLRAFTYLLGSATLGLILMPLLAALLLLLPLQAILLGALERQRMRLLGYPAPATPHVRVPGIRWLSVRLGEPSTWREVADLLATIIFGFLGLVLLVAWSTATATPIAIVVEAVISPHRRIVLFGDVAVVPDWRLIPFYLVVAVVMLALGAYVAGVLTTAQALVARALLSPREEELERRLAQLIDSRLSLVGAFEDERRRIERELHDGVQQRLVALTVHLGIAELELAAVGPDAADALSAVTAAHTQAERALSDLRRTVRGIHPQVLADHGLAAAVAELAEHAGVAVDLDVDPGRMPSPFEAAAYFTASEALGNATRHAEATRVVIRARNDDDGFRLTVDDDGRGGADPARGTGLIGLVQRAETLGGVLELSSPPGGPTRVALSFPRRALGGRLHGKAPDAHRAR